MEMEKIERERERELVKRELKRGGGNEEELT